MDVTPAPGTVKGAPFLRRSPVPNYRAILEHLRIRIEDNKNKLDPLQGQGSKAPDNAASSLRGLPVPNYATILNDLKALPEQDETIRNVSRLEVERLYLVELVLTRLALFAAHIRVADGNPYSDKLESLEEARSNLTAYSNAISNFQLVNQNPKIKIADIIENIQKYLDETLRNLATTTVAIEQYDERLGNYDKEVGDKDRDALQAIETGLLHLEKLQLGQAKAIGELIDRTIPDMLRNTLTSAEQPLFLTELHGEETRIYKKLAMAVFGGFALLAPMLIMVLHPGLLTVLVTTSVFVMFVAALLAVFMREAEPMDIAAATVAYAAVLVVFVGTSGTSRNSESNQGSSLSNGKIGGIVVGSIAATLLFLWLVMAVWTIVLTEYEDFHESESAGKETRGKSAKKKQNQSGSNA